MNKKIVLWLCILFTITAPKSYSQNQQKIDSLLNVLKTAKEDTNKVNMLNGISKLSWQASDYENAEKNAKNALQLAEKIKYKYGIADAYNNLGIIYMYQGNSDDALKNSLLSLNIAEGLEKKQMMSVSYSNISNIYKQQGNFPEAMRNELAALKISEDISDTNGIAASYLHIGVLYQKQVNYPEALNYLTQALKISEAIGDKRMLATIYNNLGITYRNQKKFDLAIKNITAALKINQEMGRKLGVAVAYNTIGNIYLDQDSLPQALKNYLAALKIETDIGAKEGMAIANLNIGGIYVEQKKYEEALLYLNKGLALSYELRNKEVIQNCYESLTELDSCMGNFKQAFLHHKLFTVYKDSLFNEESSRQITETKTKYETEKKDKEITVLNKDKEIQNVEIKKQKLLKYSFIGGLGLVLILVFLGYRTYRTRQLLKLQTLRNKIASDLHDDVGSTLSSIALFSDVAQQQSKEVMPMLQSISESSRKMLDAMADIVWTINAENDNFEKIILRMRSFAYELLGAKKIDFDFKADEGVSQVKLSMEARKNLYLIFKEAINNLVKYSEANRASFSITGTKNNLTMLIRDNGKGFDVEKLTQGNGLKNMKKRATEIGAKLLIESEPTNGTTIQLILAA